MRYLGGKTRIAKQLAAEIDKVRRPGQWVWDAFCGGLSMTKALSVNGPVYSTDACVPLINMYRAVQAGWDPPSFVDEATYRAAKALPDTDPMKAFCGFGCSFGGIWFRGLASPRSAKKGGGGKLYDTAASCRSVLIRDAPGCTLDVADFLTCEPRPLDGVLYLDPPYEGTASYEGVSPFDHNAFRGKVRAWSEHCHVYVSEYAFPLGLEVFAKNPSGSSCFANKPERLYYIAKGSL